ncbi:DUF4397 domain-containing protein [Larkinella humicola]|uniref:DUF4397 domain-containing protein n=1 Tax=Larkinella humicola TaxID=2607654 RepID=A0A5N1JKS3_9BACT|nr:DUF4397 domain-containing protein [Larkinella humicola]KAA9357060.1 DUF4397 domain-containing protein [Larkinella humicola]
MSFFPTILNRYLTRFCLQSLCAVLLLSVTVSCKKETEVEPDSGRVIFWSSNKAIETVKVDCFVDGTKVGTLSKVTASAPSCDATGSPVTTVKAGEHELEFRAANGQSFSETFTVEAGKCVDFELM